MKATRNRMSRVENSKSQTDNGPGGSKSWRALQATVRALFFNEWDKKQLENSHQRGNPISAVSLFGLRKAPATTTSMLKFCGSLVFQRERDRDRWRRLYKWPSNQVENHDIQTNHNTVLFVLHLIWAVKWGKPRACYSGRSLHLLSFVPVIV